MNTLARMRMYANFVKVEHSIFALPFAYMALLLAAPETGSWREWGLITLAMVGGRSAGMALNRIIDREIDARNPRTASREIPSGKISVTHAWIFSGASLVMLVWSAWQLNPVCAWVSPIIVFLLTLYPYMKRISWLTHFVLGAVYFCIPTGVWLAVTDQVTFASVFLGLAMGTWVAGFDVLYTLQDMESDRKERLHSIPVRFGPVIALGISSFLHLQTILWLTGVGWLLHLGVVYWIGVAGTAALLWFEHRLLTPQDYSRLNQAFFTLNGCISFWLFFIVLISRYL